MERDTESGAAHQIHEFTHADWRVTYRHSPILSIPEMDRAADLLAFSPPEMLFGNDKFEIQYRSAKSISLNAIDALRLVARGPGTDTAIRVKPARDWQTSRAGSGITRVVNPFDWTYTTRYTGSGANITFAESQTRIDVARLTARDPILFYDSGILYEDDLGDFGSCVLSYKFRFMQSATFLLLIRFFLRVDGVLFRIYDTRYVHEPSTDGSSAGVLIKQVSRKQADYSSVLAKIQAPTASPGSHQSETSARPDFSKLNNADFVDSLITDHTFKANYIHHLDSYL
ncbi:TIP41-like protein [Smittium mucronatum]|uniref:TIP41-like protein n=1 Tax=Smittium mucronatum TaxID=133383 RepID=A0A1R0GU76_9FUNG|nr:TIP41-like protein [Smittium mucronatum]